MTVTSHYDVLGLDTACSQVQIKAAYKSLLVQTHPDKQGEPQPDDAPARHNTQTRLSAIQDAYAVLRDEAKRKRYDAELQAAKAQQAVHPWQRVTPGDMDVCDDETAKTYDCRCGDVFSVPCSELPASAPASGGGAAALLLECRSCGNVLEVVGRL